MVEPLRRPIEPFDCIAQAQRMIAPQYWLFVALAAVTYLLGSIGPFYLLLGPLVCGLHLCLRAAERGERASFDLLFKGFEWFGQCAIASLVALAPTLVVIVSMYIGFAIALLSASDWGESEPPPALLVAYVAVVLVICALSGIVLLVLMLAYKLIVDHELSGIDALKKGAAAVLTNFGGLLGLGVLLSLAAVVSALLCVFPFFLFLPIAFGAIEIAYRKLFPIAKDRLSPSTDVEREGAAGWGSG